MQVLRHSGYRRMPWRNGLGTTLEIARDPAGAGDFRWRLSLASVTADGPFSAYPGYGRLVALVSGHGFALSVDDGTPIILDTIGAHARFAGGSATICRLLDGSCTDLSLMVQEPGRIIAVRRPGAGIEQLDLPVATTHAVFVLAGTATAAVAGGTKTELHTQDTLVITNGSPRSLTLRSAPDTALLQLAWSPNPAHR